MRFAEIIETTAECDLEKALNLWVEGKMAQAQPLLLRLSAAAQQFAIVKSTHLLRGFIPRREQWEQLKSDGYFDLISPSDTPFKSWSTSRKAVKRFMLGWEQHWVMIIKPVSQLDIFVNLAEYTRLTQPFTDMSGQNEVIVRMPPVMKIMRTELSKHYS